MISFLHIHGVGIRLDIRQDWNLLYQLSSFVYIHSYMRIFLCEFT